MEKKLNRNFLHIPELCGPLYSLCKNRQRPGCGVYSSYKEGFYLFFPELILQVEDYVDNIISYRYLGRSHQGNIDYIEPNSNKPTPITTPSVSCLMFNPP